MNMPSYNAPRDRFAGRLLELARKLQGNPSAKAIEIVRNELERLSEKADAMSNGG